MLKPFEMTEAVIEQMRTTRSIPARLYNKDGQTLIFPKNDISAAELEKLFKFNYQGVFYDPADGILFGLETPKTPPKAPVKTLERPEEIPTYDGLTATRLINQEMAKKTADEAQELLSELRESTLTETRSRKTRERLDSLFDDFESQGDAMTGVVNVLEVLGGMSVMPAPQMAVKRTIVSMAMKTRGMTTLTNRDKLLVKAQVRDVMMASMLCDVGYARMQTPTKSPLTQEERNYMTTHPMMSFLLVANDDSLPMKVKFNVLNHHRPMAESGRTVNNYPPVPWLKEKLQGLISKNLSEPDRQVLVRDSKQVLSDLEKIPGFDEDLHILALASEFASLTTETPWRPAFSAERAVQMIINNSFFTHSDRIVREFLDGVSVSLNQNHKILKEEDFVVLQSTTAENKPVWEVAQITTASRWQSRPGIHRLGIIQPKITREPKLALEGFDPETLKKDPRRIHVELAQDPQRRIVYCINPEYDGPLYDAVVKSLR